MEKMDVNFAAAAERMVRRTAALWFSTAEGVAQAVGVHAHASGPANGAVRLTLAGGAVDLLGCAQGPERMPAWVQPSQAAA